MQSLRIFIGLDPIPVYRVSEPIHKESMLKMHVKAKVCFLIMGKVFFVYICDFCSRCLFICFIILFVDG